MLVLGLCVSSQVSKVSTAHVRHRIINNYNFVLYLSYVAEVSLSISYHEGRIVAICHTIDVYQPRYIAGGGAVIT